MLVSQKGRGAHSLGVSREGNKEGRKERRKKKKEGGRKGRKTIGPFHSRV